MYTQRREKGEKMVRTSVRRLLHRMPRPFLLLRTFLLSLRLRRPRSTHTHTGAIHRPRPKKRVIRQTKQQTRLLRDLLNRMLDRRGASGTSGCGEGVEVEGDDGDACCCAGDFWGAGAGAGA